MGKANTKHWNSNNANSELKQGNTYMPTDTQDKPVTGQQDNAQADKANKPDFGKGRYSAEMERIYNELQAKFGVEPKKAEKIARQAGTDAGAAFRNVSATIKVGKATGKDKTMTISDASTAKGVTVTNALACVRALQWINEAGKNFVSYGFTGWKFAPELVIWIDEMKIQ